MDAILAIRTALLNDTGISNLVGSNIYGGQLPEHYNPEVSSTAEPGGDGPAITLLIKGGETHAEIPLQDFDVQITSWAGINDNYTARLVYQMVFQVLHGQTFDGGSAGVVKSLLATVPGQDMVDPDTGWVMNVSVFHVLMVDSVPSTMVDVSGFDDDFSQYQVGGITGLDGNPPSGESFS